MAEERTRNKPSFNPRSYLQLVVVGGIAVLLIFLFKVFVSSGERQWAGDVEPTALTGQGAGHAPLPDPVAAETLAARNAESVTAALARREARAHAEIQIAKFNALYGQTDAIITSLDRLITEWDTRSKELLTNDDGKRIASEQSAVIQFKALLDVPRPGKAIAERLRTACRILKGPVDEALVTPESIWSPDKSILELQQVFNEAKKAHDDYTDAIQAIKRLALVTPTTAPAGITLSAAIDQVAAEKANAHAMELKKIADAAEAEKQEKEIEAAKELNRKAAIAHDPDALKLLDFTGMGSSREGYGFFACVASQCYESETKFIAAARSSLSSRVTKGFGRWWEIDEATRDEYNRRNSIAQQQFNMSLYELFKVVVLSESNQKYLASNEHAKREIKALQARGDTKKAADLADKMKNSRPLPKPKYP